MKIKRLLIFLTALCAVVPLARADAYAPVRQQWLDKAIASTPELKTDTVRPERLVTAVADPMAYQGWRLDPAGDMAGYLGSSLKEDKNKSVIVDFGRHLTGAFSFRVDLLDRVLDGPIRLRFTFAEVPAELATPFDPYPGTISRGWLQDETVTVEFTDSVYTLPRRLSGRYMKIEVLGHPVDCDFTMGDLVFVATSSAPEIDPAVRDIPLSPEFAAIDRTALATLAECMQTVYEDGPKRDRRLWIGDVYLESLANSLTFKNHELTRHCLYLLAALANEDGRLHANVFEFPVPHPQRGSFCYSYSLLFNMALAEYLAATGDYDTALDLWPVARNQIDNILTFVDERGIFDRFRPGGFNWLFFDWRDGIEESTAMQGLVIMVLERTRKLAKDLSAHAVAKGVANPAAGTKAWADTASKMRKAARRYLYDKKSKAFVSGYEGYIPTQKSVLSQVWMVLADVVPAKEGADLLGRALVSDDFIRLGSPYAHHFLVEAMIKCGMDKEARDLVADYWGGMVRKGADTFWEVYDPADDYLSPYKFHPVNSYCHAWSCTPAYFLRRYPSVFQGI